MLVSIQKTASVSRAIREVFLALSCDLAFMELTDVSVASWEQQNSLAMHCIAFHLALILVSKFISKATLGLLCLVSIFVRSGFAISRGLRWQSIEGVWDHGIIVFILLLFLALNLCLELIDLLLYLFSENHYLLLERLDSFSKSVTLCLNKLACGYC